MRRLTGKIYNTCFELRVNDGWLQEYGIYIRREHTNELSQGPTVALGWDCDQECLPFLRFASCAYEGPFSSTAAAFTFVFRVVVVVMASSSDGEHDGDGSRHGLFNMGIDDSCSLVSAIPLLFLHGWIDWQSPKEPLRESLGIMATLRLLITV